MELVEIECPDCAGTFWKWLGAFNQCATCGGKGRVAVERKNIIKLSR